MNSSKPPSWNRFSTYPDRIACAEKGNTELFERKRITYYVGAYTVVGKTLLRFTIMAERIRLIISILLDTSMFFMCTLVCQKNVGTIFV